MNSTGAKEGQAAGPTFAVKAVGYVRSPYAEPSDVQHTHDRWTGDVSSIQLLPRYARLLGGLEGYSHVLVVFWVHRAGEWRMPKHHHRPRHVKVFATRMPVRPNPIGLSAVELMAFSAETGEVKVRGLDAVDGTPVLDIKPYIPNFDSVPQAAVPSWVAEHLSSHFHGGRSHGHRHDHAREHNHAMPPAQLQDAKGGPAQNPATTTGTEPGANWKEE